MKPLLKCSKRFIPRQTDGMICFYSNIGCSESKVIFKWRKNNNNSKNNKKSLYKEQTFAPRVFHSVSVRTLTEGDKQTQAIRDAQKLFFSALKDQHWRHSLQSITRPFQKRFREVFGNARILIFYLSIKTWEEKSLPKSHLGWFSLVFGEGIATKENISIFWFIWPLKFGV